MARCSKSPAAALLLSASAALLSPSAAPRRLRPRPPKHRSTPFAGVTIADTNSGATDTLTITLSGAGGTLTGTAAAITGELDALSFTRRCPEHHIHHQLRAQRPEHRLRHPATDSTTSVSDSDTDPAVIASCHCGSKPANLWA
jgi:hypothetical protein